MGIGEMDAKARQGSIHRWLAGYEEKLGAGCGFFL